MLISLVVAVAENGVIGADNGLPWRLKGDMRHFRSVTMGKPVIMGRKTFDSIGKPLPGRFNIVLTRAGGSVPDGVYLAGSLEEAFQAARDSGADEACVIGGADIYGQALAHADRIHLTRVHMDARGDTVFPPFDMSRWREVSRERHEAGEADTSAYSIIQLDRIAPAASRPAQWRRSRTRQTGGTVMTEFTEVASGLRFPEGPIAMDDGSIVLVEIARGTLSRVTPDGNISVIADLGGGPNGAAIGPDGAVYVCNNGGFEWHDRDGLLIPGDKPADYSGGRIERVDLSTGKVDVLYTECDGVPLNGPNDIVFDKQGGFWFTDLGKSYGRVTDRGALFYAKPDGSSITQQAFPLNTPNGVGLSPDEKTVYFADTVGGRLWSLDIESPGVARAPDAPLPANLVVGLPDLQYFDSLAVDADGNVCVATIFNGGITSISPDGQTVRHTPLPDLLVTNICFGGADLKTAYITLSGTGKLVKMAWPTAGLPLNFLNT